MTSVASLGVGSVLLQNQNIEQLSSILMGLDPLFVVGLWGVGFFGLGWLAGPLLGGLGFKALYGKHSAGMAAVGVLFPGKQDDGEGPRGDNTS